MLNMKQKYNMIDFVTAVSNNSPTWSWMEINLTVDISYDPPECDISFNM